MQRLYKRHAGLSVKKQFDVLDFDFILNYHEKIVCPFLVTTESPLDGSPDFNFSQGREICYDMLVDQQIERHISENRVRDNLPTLEIREKTVNTIIQKHQSENSILGCRACIYLYDQGYAKKLKSVYC